MMLVFLLSVAFIAAVFLIGVGVARAISIIPLSILDRAANGGRYTRLGCAERPSPVKAVGRRTPPLYGTRSNGLLMTGVHAG